MTPTRVASILLRLIGWVVLVASGIYLLVYLYRWEWNRALISGLFFVAAEVALASSAILRRLAQLERRVDEASHASPQQPPTPHEGGDGGPFAWLSDDRLGVFVPLLLGFGVIVSALAYVVERVAGASGAWAGIAAAQRRMRRLARPHAALVPMVTDAVAASPASVRFVPPQVGRRRTRRAVAWAAGSAAAVLLLVGAITLLADIAMYRPETRPTTGSTTYSLFVELREGRGDRASVANALWLSCRDIVGHDASADITPADGGHITMTVRPEVATNDDRRFVGCLEDVTLDRVRVDVVSGLDEPAGVVA
jgi:hypothetical protein